MLVNTQWKLDGVNFMSQKPITIILSGGGTGGSVTPLLAVAKQLFSVRPDVHFSFIGTKHGPEARLVSEAAKELPLVFSTMVAGKWRRYFSLKNLIDLLLIILAFGQSFFILAKQRPQAIISAGSFVSVPLVWAAWFCRVPVLIHQQDLRPGLANKLMAPFAKQVTVTFNSSLKTYGAKAIVTGNPYFLPLLDKREVVLARYHLDVKRPLTLIFGGGTGAVALNQAVAKNLSALLEHTQLIHLSGRGKMIARQERGYDQQEFVSHQELLSLMSAADLVVARPGLGTLTELAALKKASILVPMPNSHQEDNAQVAQDAGAASVLSQANLNDNLVAEIERLLNQEELKEKLERQMASFIKPGAKEALANIILSWIK